MAPKIPDIKLSDRDRKILQHVKQYRITTFDVLHRLFFADKKPDAVVSTLRRLCGKYPDYRYLRADRLYGKRKYFRLTALGAQTTGAHREATRRPGLQAKAIRYAILAFLHERGAGERWLFNPREFPDQFDLGGDRLPRKSFYIENHPQGPRLGFIVVNLRSDPLRVTRKCVDILARFLQRGWFDEFIAAGRFVLTVITTDEDRKKSLELHLRRAIADSLSFPLSRFTASPCEGLPFEINVAVVPDLLYLIPGQSPDGHRPATTRPQQP